MKAEPGLLSCFGDSSKISFKVFFDHFHTAQLGNKRRQSQANRFVADHDGDNYYG